MRWLVGIAAFAVACTAAGSADRSGERSLPHTVDLDSLTVTDSVGLAIGTSKRIRIAYWAEDQMVYCAMATLASIPEMEAPVVSEQRNCVGVELLAVDSVRFQDGSVVTPAQLREQTVLRVEAKP